MARYIDADLIGLTDIEIIMCDGDYKEALRMLIDKIEHAPTADVAPVVRCKDCIWWRDEDCTNPIGMFLPEEDSFCSCGIERRTDE